jgi:HK97 family phage major capsid protein
VEETTRNVLGFRRDGRPIYLIAGAAPGRLEEILKRQEQIQAELKALEELPEPEGDEAQRAQTMEDRNSVTDQLLAEFDQLEEERQPLAEREARRARVFDAIKDPARQLPGLAGGVNDPTVHSRGGKINPYGDLPAVRAMTMAPNDVISRALAAVEQAPDYVTEEQKENVDGLIRKSGRKQGALIARHILLTGSPEYHDAFYDYMSNPTDNVQRAALSLTNANGGYLVPFTLDPSVILTNSGSANPYRQISAIKTTATNTWNGVSSAGMNAAWLAEAGVVADASPTFSNISITPQKAAAWVFGSYEILEDSDFESELPTLLADAKDRLEEAAFTTGSGTGQPKGIITAATTLVTGHKATGTGLDVSDLYSTQAALPARFRRRAAWVMAISMINTARQFDTAGGSSYWTTLGQGSPEMLLGGGIYESTTMAAYVTTAGTKVAVYGDWKQYAIVDRIGMSVMYEPMVKDSATGRPTGQGGWFAFWRVGGDALVPGAFRVLTTP